MKGYRTLIVNILTGIATAIAGIVLHLGDLGLEPETVAWLSISAVMLLAIVNTVLRIITNTAVGKSE